MARDWINLEVIWDQAVKAGEDSAKVSALLAIAERLEALVEVLEWKEMAAEAARNRAGQMAPVPHYYEGGTRPVHPPAGPDLPSKDPTPAEAPEEG